MIAPKCTISDGIQLQKNLEQPHGQEILEEGTYTPIRVSV